MVGGAVGAVGAALAGARKRSVLSPHDPGGPGRSARRGERWHVVTVFRTPDEVAPDGSPPPPVDRLEGLEVRMRPAPKDRGTEIAVRAGEDADHGAIRLALREAKQLLETGEILLPDGPPTTRPSLLNAPLRKVTASARKEGRL